MYGSPRLALAPAPFPCCKGVQAPCSSEMQRKIIYYFLPKNQISVEMFNRILSYLIYIKNFARFLVVSVICYTFVAE